MVKSNLLESLFRFGVGFSAGDGEVIIVAFQLELFTPHPGGCPTG